MKPAEKYDKIIDKDSDKFVYKHSINGSLIFIFVAIGIGLTGYACWLQADGSARRGACFCFLLCLLFIYGGIFGEEIDESEFNFAKGTLTISKVRHGKPSIRHVYKSLDFESINWTGSGIIINLRKQSVVSSVGLPSLTKASNSMQTAYELGRAFSVPV
jgi:hypothetical protein